MVESLKELNAICQKPQYKEVGNWMVRKILRPIALPITWCLLHTPVSANQVTLAALLSGLLGVFLTAFPGPGFFLAGTILLQLWYLLDHVDGQVARYRKTSGLTGRFYDFLMHHVIHSAVLFALGFYAYARSGQVFGLVWGFVASLAVVHFNLLHDIRCKAYVEHLLSARAWKIKSGETGGAEKAPPQPQGLRKIFSILHKTLEVHVMMNMLTACALLEFWLKKGGLRGLLFLYFSLAAVVLVLVKAAYLIRTRKIDLEFQEKFEKIE